ncbi:hypothetical protein BJP34_08705 [Moorena producens PAL-8-15-08-1]|uniref:Uncharacterized protein n=1 Tax=Moorena producens PAL-8-15-08-1 TaxID=1458985 RepID=A0A1D8TPF5_9CYAN|nr:hypothetical protein BJP34_08705 [Moorena producens PAL-8-15-08-1]
MPNVIADIAKGTADLGTGSREQGAGSREQVTNILSIDLGLLYLTNPISLSNKFTGFTPTTLWFGYCPSSCGE